MVAVRYAALAALVLWLSGMLSLVAGDSLRHQIVWYGCGALVLLSLFVMKFVGPPPRAFIPRASIVAIMLIIELLGAFQQLSMPVATGASLALGAILLFWYAHE
jgi:hypothetical protein